MPELTDLLDELVTLGRAGDREVELARRRARHVFGHRVDGWVRRCDQQVEVDPRAEPPRFAVVADRDDVLWLVDASAERARARGRVELLDPAVDDNRVTDVRLRVLRDLCLTSTR